MARLPRLYAPSAVHHVVQRAAEGRDLIVDADDYAVFMDILQDAIKRHGLALHAYVLLPREIQLLATPSEPDSMARTMQAIGRRYVPYVNRKAARAGALWDRRFRSTLIEADEYLLACMRHIETRPAAEGLAASAEEWRWSSYGHHVGSAQQAFINDHAIYWALRDTPFERQAAYRAIVSTPLESQVIERIRDATERGWALGRPTFLAEIEATTNRRALPLQRGRPRKPAANE